jgi:hypothetical protein
MPDSTDGSSDSEDDPQSVELGQTKVSMLDDRADSWLFQAEMWLDLSGAGFDPSALIDLAKQVTTSYLCHQQAIVSATSKLNSEKLRTNQSSCVIRRWLSTIATWKKIWCQSLLKFQKLEVSEGKPQ